MSSSGARGLQPLLPFYRICGTRNDLWKLSRYNRHFSCTLLCEGLNVDGEKKRVFLCMSHTSKPEAHEQCKVTLRINRVPYFGVPLEILDISRYVALRSNHFSVVGLDILDDFSVAIHVVEKVPKDELLRSVAEGHNSIHDVATTKRLAHDLLTSGNCEDVIVDFLTVSLNCPLKKTRLQVPCRGVDCRHVQCFDALAYLELNESTLRPFWRCPVCDQSVKVKELRIDLFTLEMLDALPEKSGLVQISPEGKWTPVEPGFESKSKGALLADGRYVIDLTGDTSSDEEA
ncbi:E3 SUMO-protein ligase PIAS2-like [Ixodes scapularis]|uniref:E3 SUMO-protein ligase PIAS2-like n=1 Tax=Ixodes scapularis TaxID=6945 RepID=UPI001C38C496|nr:E3 SUMO-protein ligase PIAS2-like [Ixodes scapularis]